MIHRYASLPSTMPEAVRLAAEGAPHGTTVVAVEQTAGIGRRGHTWHSAAGEGLYCSVILRLDKALPELPVTTLALGLATAEAIARVTDTVCDLRWPNDVLLTERKCAGILVQQHGAALVAGIGVNLNQTSFPPELALLATSLRLATGRSVEPDVLLRQLLISIELFVHEPAEAVLRLFAQASSYVSGRRVSVEQPQGQLLGTTAGLDQHGFLRVRTAQGQVQTITAGGVRPVQ